MPSGVSQRPLSGAGSKKEKARVKSGDKKDKGGKEQKGKEESRKKSGGKKDGQFLNSLSYL